MAVKWTEFLSFSVAKGVRHCEVTSWDSCKSLVVEGERECDVTWDLPSSSRDGVLDRLKLSMESIY